jgi:hypothetical protein
MACPWRDPTGPLIRLAETFALDVAKLPLKESRQKLSYSEENFEAAKLTLPDEAKKREERLTEFRNALQAAKDHYGTALTFQLKIGNNNFLLDRNLTIDDFYGKVGDSQYLEVYLEIDKAELLPHWKLDDPAVTTCLFLFSDALLRTLTLPLTELDEGDNALFRDDKKLVVYVPEQNIALDGKRLAIVGGDALEQPRNGTDPDALAVKAVYEKAREELNWISFELRCLTPLHLKVDGAVAPRDDIAAVIYAQLLTCSLLYMANQSKQLSDSLWVSTFASETSAVKIEIPDAQTIGAMLRAASADNSSLPAKTIAEKVAWIYEDLSQAADRLTVAQNAVVEALENSDPSTACRELVRRAADVASRIDWAWQAFISGKLNTYFSQVKQLVDTIDSSTKSYNEQVQTLTKSLIDNMLAAVAVIIGSFIAAIFKSPFERYVFWFGTGAYVLYLLVFPIAVGLYATLQRFRQSRADFGRSIVQFSRGVPKAQVVEIVGTAVFDRERWFMRWWGATLGLYLLVVVVLVVAAIVVPGQIKAWSDTFKLRSVAYGQTSGGAVPMTIRGDDFNDEKEIVVRIGNAKYTNTDGGSLAVRGSTVLALTPRLDELRGSRYLTVQQGTAGPVKLTLPRCP